MSFVLDARLAADSRPVIELPLSAVRLALDARYPWLLVIPRRAGLVELIDLAPEDQHVLWDELARVAHALRAAVPCDKLNVAALGNVVSQLHVHVIARRRDDAAWPRPVWGAVAATTYADGGEALARQLAAALA